LSSQGAFLLSRNLSLTDIRSISFPPVHSTSGSSSRTDCRSAGRWAAGPPAGAGEAGRLPRKGTRTRCFVICLPAIGCSQRKGTRAQLEIEGLAGPAIKPSVVCDPRLPRGPHPWPPCPLGGLAARPALGVGGAGCHGQRGSPPGCSYFGLSSFPCRALAAEASCGTRLCFVRDGAALVAALTPITACSCDSSVLAAAFAG